MHLTCLCIRACAQVYHPDRQGGSNAAFQRVASAYETLTDPARRQAYDQARAQLGLTLINRR